MNGHTLMTLGLLFTSVAHAGHEGLATRMSMEFKDIKASNLFQILAEVTQREVEVDPCVRDDLVTLKLKNVPASVVFDTVASRLGLTYVTEGKTIFVRCGGATPAHDERLEHKVTIEVVDVSLELALRSLVDQVGGEQKITEIRCDVTAPKVTLRLQNVRLRTALEVLKDMTSLDFRLAGSTLTVKQEGERPPAREPAANPTRK